MVENLLLAVAGGVAGVVLASALSRFLVSMLAAQDDSLFLDLHPDLRLLAFAALLASVTCVLFGLAPALNVTRAGLGDALKSAARSLSASRKGVQLRQVLVAAQVALALVLLVGAFLFSGTLRNLLALDAGFERTGVLVTQVDFRRLKIPEAARIEFKLDLLEKIRALPGTLSAAQVGIMPLSGVGWSNMVWKEGDGAEGKVEANFDSIGEGYFRTMGIRLLAGRDFNSRDQPGSPKVAIVNQTFARRLGLGPNPVGARFTREPTPSSPAQVFEIAGLVRDTKYHNLREDFKPIAFLALDQAGAPDTSAQIVIRSSLPLKQTTSAVRGMLARTNPLITSGFQSFETQIQEGLLRERLMATLSGFFGLLGALIAAVGLYGVMSYLVVRRTNEIGVRMALGAARSSIVALILRQAGFLLAIGVPAGAVLSLAVTGAARSLLFGLKPFDVSTIAMAVALLTAVAALASYLPARRAARIEPVTAIRED
jgi:predicted permease